MHWIYIIIIIYYNLGIIYYMYLKFITKTKIVNDSMYDLESLIQTNETDL